MMVRSVIWIQHGHNGDLPRVLLVEPDNEHEDAGISVALKTADDKNLFEQMKIGPWQPDLVEKVGQSLYKLLTSNNAIAFDFKKRFDPNAADEPRPVYLRVDEVAELEELPWEALSDPRTGFVALDKRWPIARMRKVSETKGEYVFLPPLRIMAVLGASGSDADTRISAEPEWDEFFKAISSSGLNIKLRVLTCEADLKQKIDDLKLDWITTDFLQEGQNLFQDVHDFGPQILHFFCHGAATTPPQLEIASNLDWKRKLPGTIFVEGSQLRQLADSSKNVWLVTLNCCESAAQGAGGGSRSRSLASSLVSHGFPAVIGMRERVDSMHANRFCGYWYSQMLRVFEEQLASAAKDNGTSVLHWATALFAARQGICSTVESVAVAEGAPRIKEWTIPVLYTRDQPFSIRAAPDPDGSHPIRRAPPAAPATVQPVAAGGLTLQQKVALVSEMQELLATRDSIASQANLPEAVRAGVLAEITTRLTVIEHQLS